MATKAAKKANRSQQLDPSLTKVDWRGFAQYYLDEKTKETVRKQLLGVEQAYEFVVSLLEDGYKVTITEDRHNSSYIVSATGLYADNPNAGFTLTTRHRDLQMALTLFNVLHNELFGKVWPRQGEDSHDW